MSAIVLEAGNILTLTGNAPSDGVNVANGTLIYGANQTDTSINYLLGESGHTEIAAGVTLTSNYCSLNSMEIADNTTGAGYYIETLGSGAVWVVNSATGEAEERPPIEQFMCIISATVLQNKHQRQINGGI